MDSDFNMNIPFSIINLSFNFHFPFSFFSGCERVMAGVNNNSSRDYTQWFSEWVVMLKMYNVIDVVTATASK